jgi:hypothetical protein
MMGKKTQPTYEPTKENTKQTKKKKKERERERKSSTQINLPSQIGHCSHD